MESRKTLHHTTNVAIIGAGPSGLTAARLLAEKGCKITVFEKRSVIGGNCFDAVNEDGILIHPYGPHYFRTNSRKLLNWLSKFTKWRPANYFVRAEIDDELVPIPVNLNTMIQLSGNVFDKSDLKKYLDGHKVAIKKVKNSEEQCLATVGRKLYEKIYKNYTRKQWGQRAAELNAEITARLPLRFDFNDRYPSEYFQLMPRDGYTLLFKNIAQHPDIQIKLDCEIFADDILKLKQQVDLIIYTGPVDQYFNYQYGHLEYRSLRFQWKTYPQDYKQPCVQINYPNAHDYTRSVEIKHVTGQRSSNTTVCYEYPTDEGEPFYPLLSAKNISKNNQYQKLAIKELQGKTPVHFIGRLAEFQYYNMDQVFLRSMNLANMISKKGK
ncbi:MAG TPA: UDP-galactopyranose mutase [Smithella sp.]|nr:UDP-galactopyranose mutase [Smithella sp.]HOG89132.1 UDP-galactopyranose mutase [Smithella sp.]